MVCIRHMTAICAVVLLPIVLSAPVQPPPKQVPVEKTEGDDTGLHYDRYLREVVAVLESDPDFKKRLEEANLTDIKSGKIAQHLDLVKHGYRTQLDEIKRREVDRLRKYHKEQIALNEAGNLKFPDHIDHRNEDTFEIEDLRKLILKATQDLDDLDKQRKEEFKEYEMEKEHEKREKLKNMDEAHRKEEEKKMEEMKKKHEDHKPINHPGSKKQLEEVWEENDGMKGEEFNPKAFFMMHDGNGDGVWDPMEMEALFEKELEKSFDENNPEDDPVEKEENRQRMREHVMKEIDLNKDSLVSMEEFLKNTQSEDFDKNEEWKDAEDYDDIFSEDEFNEFEKHRDDDDDDDDDDEDHEKPSDDHKAADVEETQDIYTDDEYAEYEKMLAAQEDKRNELLQGHAQPGEVHVPPPVDQQGHGADAQMNQQQHAQAAGQGHQQPPVVGDHAQPQAPVDPQGHKPEQPVQGGQQHEKEGQQPQPPV